MEKVAIFIPSLNRPHKIVQTVVNIRQTTPEDHEIYYMVSDDESKEILERLGVKYFWDQGGDTRYVTRMNYMCANTTEPYMFTGSDDVEFHPNWLSNLLKEIKPGTHVIVPDDMFNPQGTEALVTREYVNTQSCCVDVPNVLFYPGYKHQYADTEQFETAKYRGVFARAMDSKVEHKHFVNGKESIDETYTYSMDHEQSDRQLYNSRKYLWEK